MTMVNINGQDSKEYFSATLIDKTIGTSKINYETQWNRLASEPIITDTTMGDKKINMKFLVEGNSELIVRRNIGNLISQLNNGVIEFSDAPLNYRTRVSEEPTITWFGDTDTGADKYRYVLEIDVVTGLAWGENERISQVVSIGSSRQVTVDFNIKGNYTAPLVISAEILDGATTEHLIYFGINVDPNFELLNEYVKDKFAFIDVGDSDIAEVDSEQFKIRLNGNIHLPSFRGDFPFAKPGSNSLNIEFASLMSDEDLIDMRVIINYLPRYI